jgi:hypothetical protein
MSSKDDSTTILSVFVIKLTHIRYVIYGAMIE